MHWDTFVNPKNTQDLLLTYFSATSVALDKEAAFVCLLKKQPEITMNLDA